MRHAKTIAAFIGATIMLTGCATTMTEKRRGLDPTEANDGGLRQAPPPPEDGESATATPGAH